MISTKFLILLAVIIFNTECMDIAKEIDYPEEPELVTTEPLKNSTDTIIFFPENGQDCNTDVVWCWKKCSDAMKDPMTFTCRKVCFCNKIVNGWIVG